MHALHLGPLVVRNKEISIATIWVLGLMLLKLSFNRVWPLGNKKPGQSDSVPQEGTLEIELIIPSQQLVRIAGYA